LRHQRRCAILTAELCEPSRDRMSSSQGDLPS
jgi:hypothetical protein